MTQKIVQEKENQYKLAQTTKIKSCCIPRPLFSTKNLSVSYGSERALSDVSIEINNSCLTAIVGPSGCGKSTFILTLGRLIKLFEKVLISGSVTYRGNELYSSKSLPAEFRSEVGFIFQKPTPFPMSIYKNIAVPVIESGIKKRWQVEQIVQESLEKVRLWDEVKNRLKRSARGLSGGQQQRLCMARALALNPKVLLMDEPTSSLDPLATGLIEELILELQPGTTTVLVTHKLSQARRLANYLAVFYTASGGGSSLVESGETEKIFNSPETSVVERFLQAG